MSQAKRSLDDRLAVARMVPGLAHLPAFGLILIEGQEAPICRFCKGGSAPIVDGQHLGVDWCDKQAASEGRFPKRGGAVCHVCQQSTRSVLDGEAWCDYCKRYE